MAALMDAFVPVDTGAGSAATVTGCVVAAVVAGWSATVTLFAVVVVG